MNPVSGGKKQTLRNDDKRTCLICTSYRTQNGDKTEPTFFISIGGWSKGPESRWQSAGEEKDSRKEVSLTWSVSAWTPGDWVGGTSCWTAATAPLGIRMSWEARGTLRPKVRFTCNRFPSCGCWGKGQVM